MTRKAREEVSRRTTIGTWNVTKPTKFVIHGFLDSPNKPWWLDMKNAILAVVSRAGIRRRKENVSF